MREVDVLLEKLLNLSDIDFSGSRKFAVLIDCAKKFGNQRIREILLHRRLTHNCVKQFVRECLITHAVQVDIHMGLAVRLTPDDSTLREGKLRQG